VAKFMQDDTGEQQEDEYEIPGGTGQSTSFLEPCNPRYPDEEEEKRGVQLELNAKERKYPY